VARKVDEKTINALSVGKQSREGGPNLVKANWVLLVGEYFCLDV
jgi:hypothetical protein